MTDRVESLGSIYSGWLSLEMAAVRMDDGAVAKREIVRHPSGAAVLLYNVAKGTALLVSQLRPPVEMAGEPRLLEVVAGIIDDSDPAACVRREAMEEAGVVVKDLEHVAQLWMTPCSSTERLDCFLATFSDEDRTGNGGGVDEEHEHLELHEVPLRDLWASAQRLEVRDAKTLLLLQALRIRRPDLF